MNTTDFLHRVLAKDGYYCLWVFNRDSDRKVQKFYTTIADLTAAALDYDAKGWDTYFATATFNTDEGRTADNAKALRSFFLDLDCGEGKEYPDQITAVQTLQNFCMRMALPKPLLVNSGRGIHVYWVMDRDLSREEWQPIADKLKAACAQHNFPMDPVVPADAARILRIPGTHNYKDTPPSPVTVLSQAGEATVSVQKFEGKFADVVVKKRTYIPQEMRAVGAALLGNHKNNFKRILTRTDPCAQLIYAATHQDVMSEPLWRATLSVAAHCEDADIAIHAMSKDHPDYDPQTTEEKARRIKGPYLCDRFDEYNPGICEHCPHFNKIKSPIVLGRELNVSETEEERTVELPTSDDPDAEPEVIVVPKPPAPYMRGASGGVYRTGTNDDGEPEDTLIYHHDLYVTRRVYDDEIGDSVLIRLHLPMDGVREFSVPQSSIGSLDKLREALSAKGVTARGKTQWERIGYYIMDYVDALQARSAADKSRRQFGWTEGMKSFVLGDREYFPGGQRLNPPNRETAELIEFLQPKGTLDEWKQRMEFFNKEGMELHQLIICTAFGSPLMEFSAIYASLLHLDGPTGFGKTTTQWAAAGVYGKPDRIMIRHDDTVASKFQRFQVMKNLPLYIDELTKCSPAEASDLAYALSSGAQKNRMSSGSNLERKRGDPWHLCAVSSGNASIMNILEAGKANTEAEQERAFEVNIKEYIYPYDKAVADEFQYAILNDVYGVAAEPYIEYLVNNVDEIRKFFKTTQERLDAACGIISKNRMTSASFTAYLAGGMIAKKLGLIPYDMTRLFDLAVKLIRQKLAETEANKKTSVDYLISYITENWNNMLRINSTQDLRNKGDSFEEEYVVADATPRISLVARWEPDTKRLFLLPKPFKKWCVDQQLNPAGLLEQIGKEYKVELKKARLGKGTKLDLPPTNVHVIELPLEEHIDHESGTA